MITRRLFIASTTTAAAATGIYWLTLKDSNSTGQPSPEVPFIESGLGEAFDSVLTSLDSSEKIAQAWLDSLENPPTKETLIESMSIYRALDTKNLEQRLRKAIQTDFLQGNICHLDGWQLSLTECQLAGLRYLTINEDPRNQAFLTDINDSSAKKYTEGRIAPLKNWGNQSTPQGKKFNVQPDGHSGLWFQFEGAPAHVKIMIDGELTRTVVSEKVVTSGLFGDTQDRILSNPGQYEIALVDPLRKVKQTIGFFEVIADPRAANLKKENEPSFCKVSKWGPQKTQAGIAANEQPDGSMGIWIHTDCFPSGTQIMFIDDPLKATPREFGATTSIPPALLGSPGEHPLYFYNAHTKEKQLIGHITVE